MEKSAQAEVVLELPEELDELVDVDVVLELDELLSGEVEDAGDVELDVPRLSLR